MVSIHYDVYQYSSCADESQPVHDRMAMPTNIITSFMMHSSIQVHGLGLDKQGSYLRRWDEDTNSANGCDGVAISNANVERWSWSFGDSGGSGLSGT